MIGEREGAILDILIREYIKTAEPVSSERIARRMKNTLSSATVRNIFTDLTDAGFIEQPHTSGGRVPKARAYRFFVDRALAGEARLSDLHSDFVRSLRALEEDIDALRDIQEDIAHHMHVISRFGSLMPLGFDEMFSEPEFRAEPRLVQEVGKFLDEFEKYRSDYDETLSPDAFEVMIGAENEIQPMRHMSVIVGKDSDDDLFFIAGPMRMPYDRIITLMQLWKKKPTNNKTKK